MHWHSTLNILKRILYLREFIKKVSANDLKIKKINLSNFDWDQIENTLKKHYYLQ